MIFTKQQAKSNSKALNFYIFFVIIVSAIKKSYVKIEGEHAEKYEMVVDAKKRGSIKLSANNVKEVTVK